MRAQIRDWVECLRENRAPPVTGEEGRLALAVGLAARRSAESGQPEEVDQ